MRTVRRRFTCDNIESDPLPSNSVVNIECDDYRQPTKHSPSLYQCAMSKKSFKKLSKSAALGVPEQIPIHLKWKFLPLFFLCAVLVMSVILIISIIATINLSKMRAEIAANTHHTSQIILQQIGKLIGELNATIDHELANKEKILSSGIQPSTIIQSYTSIPPSENVHPFTTIPPSTLEQLNTSPTVENVVEGTNPSLPTWYDTTCANMECKRTDFDQPLPVVMISFDGFSADYLKKRIVQNLDRIAKCGTKAEFIYPSYPSKTFPNHYSMATGLYPEVHGIVDNNLYDESISPELVYIPQANDVRYYKGEPIWNTVEKNGLRSACMFWVGCWQNISGIQLTYNMKYDRSFTLKQRIDKIVEWLSLPQDKRPHLIMAYFNQPDHVGHFHQSEDEINGQLRELDSLLDHLLSELHSRSLLNCINLVIVSDHGMEPLTKRYYLNDYMNISNLIISSGVVARIHLAQSGVKLDELKEHFQCSNNGTEFKMYDKMHMPKRYHFGKSNRIGDLVIEGTPGVSIMADRDSDYGIVADHGYDYLVKSMHAIFYARGPNIMPNATVKPFQNVELFNLVADLLNLKLVPPTNGTHGVLGNVMVNRSITQPYSEPIQIPRLCPPNSMEGAILKTCSSPDRKCHVIAQNLSKLLYSCDSIAPPFSVISFRRDPNSYCYFPLCAVSVFTSTNPSEAQPTVLYEPLDVNSLKQSSNSDGCFLLRGQMSNGCREWNQKQQITRGLNNLKFYSLLADPHSDYVDIVQTQALLYGSFVKGALKDLNNLTMRYLYRYKRLFVVSGAIFDYDSDGLADNIHEAYPHNEPLSNYKPSHIFRIIFRCEGEWNIDNKSCSNLSETRVLAFILPNQPSDLNCLEPMKYLFSNIARIRDVELLSGFELFSDRSQYPEQLAVELRTHITQALWDF